MDDFNSPPSAALNGFETFPLPAEFAMEDISLLPPSLPTPAPTSSNKRSLPSSSPVAAPTALPPTASRTSSGNGTNDTDDFGTSSLHFGARTLAVTESLPNAVAPAPTSAGEEQGRKRLRRGPARTESPGRSFLSSPADSDHTPPNGEPSQTVALRDHLARFNVDSQPGSSASSTYGGGDAQSQAQPVVVPGSMKRVPSDGNDVKPGAKTETVDDASSPVQGSRVARGVRPVIQDSPASVIDIRSSPTLPSPPPATQSKPPVAPAPFATTPVFGAGQPHPFAPFATAPSPSPFNPSASPHFATSSLPSPTMATPAFATPAPSSLATSPPSGAPPNANAAIEAAYKAFSQMVGTNFPEAHKLAAFKHAGGNPMSAVQLLVNAKPAPTGLPLSSPGLMGPPPVMGQPPNGAGVARPSTTLSQGVPMPVAGQSQGQFFAQPQVPQRSPVQQPQPVPVAIPAHLQLRMQPIPRQPQHREQMFLVQMPGQQAPVELGQTQIVEYQRQIQARVVAQQMAQAGATPQQMAQLQQHQALLLQQQQQLRAAQGGTGAASQSHSPGLLRAIGGGRGGVAQPSPQQLQMITTNAQQAFLRGLAQENKTAAFHALSQIDQQRHFRIWLERHQNPQFRLLLQFNPAGARPPTTAGSSSPQAHQSRYPQQAGSRQPIASASYSQASPPKALSLHERTLAALPTSMKKKKKKKRATSDSDGDGGDWSEDGSGDEWGGETPAQLARRENLAVEWFNTTTKDELCELAGCNQTQAALVIKLRPFSTPNDFRTRTRKQKGVGNTMMETYLEVIQGMHEIDTVLNECETIGKELSRIMQIWATGASAGGEAPTSLAGPPPEDVGINLVAMSEVAVEEKDSVHPEVKAAFKDYIRKQPEGVPDTIVLKDYQMLGLNWLNLLYRRGTSCILADDMGLGKTAQVISLISHLKSTGEPGPHLIIVPSSTLENWMREFSVFAPALHVESYYGSQFERSEIRSELRAMTDLDVVVTTYNIATSSIDDQKFLKRKMDFKICVFDEGHQLKNSQSKKYKDLMQIRAQWRLLLTGTPLQNNLQELISLLSFILPDQFRDATDSLKAIFKVGPGTQANLLSTERISRAKKMMTPFVLRRKKTQVLKDLPSKSERIEFCEMTILQREVYNEAITRSKKALMAVEEEELEMLVEEPEDTEAVAQVASKPRKKKGAPVASTKTGNKSDQTSSSNVLMDLRKASNHPMLFRRLYTEKTLKAMAKDCLKEEEFMDRDKDLIYEDMEVMTDFELHRFCLQYKHLTKYALTNDEWMSAGKIQKLQELLPILKANGDRVLLFSQFTQILDILEIVLETLGIKYLKLTGQTSVTERQGLVDQFTNDDEITVFLLSTRAGGLGLNLVAANHVIFYDLDYNPHNDKQAEDRSFRIGQVRDVTIIKLITKDSLDEEIAKLAETKLQLDASVSATAGAEDAVEAANGGGATGGTTQVEKKMRTSLLSNLKKKFETESQIQATQGQ